MRNPGARQSLDVLSGHGVSGELPEEVYCSQLLLGDFLCGVIPANAESSTTEAISRVSNGSSTVLR